MKKFIKTPPLTETDRQALARLLPDHSVDKNDRIRKLIDRHGTGRFVFRNTRHSVSGFPARDVHLLPLTATNEDLQQQTTEFRSFHLMTGESVQNLDYQNDPRLLWLVAFLRKNREQKVLLICRSLIQVRSIEEALRKHIKIEMALFHEQLSLLQRDRYAAWFAKKDGAQICLCSEIGSEGRNFQFAHHLVLFDLPLDPELLEQRIGRLDRIGQTETIHLYIPYLIGGEYEILARWYHEGLGAFSQHVPGIYQIYEKMALRVKSLTSAHQAEQVHALNQETVKLAQTISKKIANGRDRLLELNSLQPDIAEHLREQIVEQDAKSILEKYMVDVFELYDLRLQQQGHRTWRVNTLLLSNPEFPLPMAKDEEFFVTFDRKAACSHEDVEFITWDHPMVSGVFDMILASEKGNCAFAVWDSPENDDLILEAIYLLECVCDKRLNAERFLPPRPIRIYVDQNLKECTPSFSGKNLHDPDEEEFPFFQNLDKNRITAMLDASKIAAESSAGEIVQSALTAVQSTLENEYRRLFELAKINRNIKPEEIAGIRLQSKALQMALQGTRLRLDSLRLIHCIPFENSTA